MTVAAEEPERPETDSDDPVDANEDNPTEEQSPPDIHRLFPGPVDVRSIALTGLFALALLFSLSVARDLLLPIVLAILLKFLLAPLMRIFERLRIPAPVGAGVLLLLAVGSIGWTLYAIRAPALEWVERLPHSLSHAEEKIAELREPVKGVKEVAESVERMAAGEDDAPVQEVAISEPTLQEQVVEGTQQLLGTVAVMVALLYFLLASGELFLRKLVRVLPRLKDKKKAVEIARRIEKDVSRHLLTITVINAVLGLAIGLSLWALGMPNPILWGVLAMVLNFVPYLGAAVGTGVVSLAAFLTFDDIQRTLMVGGAYMLFTALEGSFLTPAILGRRLSLNPVAVFIGLFFWGWMWGVPGALLAVPILMTTKIVCDRVESLRAIGEFLGS